MSELQFDEIDNLKDINNFGPLKMVFRDLKLGKQWSSIKYLRIDDFNLGIIFGDKNGDSTEEFCLLPANEEENWSFDSYTKLFHAIQMKTNNPEFKRLTLAVTSGDSSITYYHIYQGIHK